MVRLVFRPLYPNLTIDLHVRIATSFHQSFLWLHPYSGIVHHLSGRNRHALTQIPPQRSLGSVDDAPPRRLSPKQTNACLHFHCADGFVTPRLARMLHSLVRVSRRVGCSHLSTNNRSARRDRPPARASLPSADTARSPHRGAQTHRGDPARGPALHA